MMKKITRDDDLSRSADLAAQNVQRLAELFPEAVVEGRVDLDVLRQLLGEHVEASSERFGLSWKGKAQARQLALQPSTGTLRPCPEESVDWEKTQNVFIEGDNLEVLKLLQKSYQGQVKLIYIDPPYNTGNDFIYPDDFQDNIKRYLEVTGQLDGGGRRLSSNTESGGRLHTTWLNMIFPRLMLAQSLMRDDGLIFISIDDRELSNLIQVCDNVFGDDCRVATFVWEKRTNRENRKLVSSRHDYIVCYCRRSERREDAIKQLPMDDEALARYDNRDDDPRGAWKSDPATAQAGHGTRGQFYTLIAPNGKAHTLPSGRCWVYTQEVMAEAIRDGRIWFGQDGNGVPRIKTYLDAKERGLTPESLWFAEGASTNEAAKNDLKDLFGGQAVFDTPKPVDLVRQMLRIGAPEGIVMDFFAGSGVTAHAVLAQNADGGNRRYLLVQIPEPLDPDLREQQTAADFCTSLGLPHTIAELTKERLRRAGKKLRAENPMFAGDLGFRVYKLDSTNLKPWDPQPEDLERQIELAIEHVKPGRSEADLLTELLLKLGLELTVHVDTHSVAGHTVYAVGGGALLACLSPKISRTDVEDLAEGIVALHQMLKPASIEPEGASARPKPARETTTVLFRDAAFADDVAKANLSAILEQRGLHNLRSL